MKIINELCVHDIDNSIHFYTNLFGFEVHETTGNPIHYARLKNGNVEIMIENYESVINEFSNFPTKTKASNLLKFKYDNSNEVNELYHSVINQDIKLFHDLKQTDLGTTEFAIFDCDENIIIISD